MKGIVHLTNDVETTSIVNGGLRDDTGVKVWKEGLPRLLELYAKYDVKATFFFIADFAAQHPEMIKRVQGGGHEVAVHGLSHEHTKAFDVLSAEEQVYHLSAAKRIIEDIAGEEVVSFRAPALRVNGNTPRALKETGYLFDSSVASQRMDMFMSLGSKGKLQWLKAPRVPYHVKQDNLARRGDMELIEVPVSSFIVPYIGTFMRISPRLTCWIRHFLYWETRNTNKRINFLIHPNEVITEEDMHGKIERQADSYISYLFSDVLRHKLKLRNLGIPALDLYEKEIAFWKNCGYGFERIKDVRVGE
nr:polysaccharide deacetylase family protein [Bacteroides intestinalis]